MIDVYKITKSFPKEELYCLTSQMRRAAISIAANIAEGFKKKSKRDKARYLNIAQASLEECRYYLILSHDLDYGDSEELNSNLAEVSKMLYAYRRAILSSDV